VASFEEALADHCSAVKLPSAQRNYTASACAFPAHIIVCYSLRFEHVPKIRSTGCRDMRPRAVTPFPSVAQDDAYCQIDELAVPELAIKYTFCRQSG
jgi:hypothetical protein